MHKLRVAVYGALKSDLELFRPLKNRCNIEFFERPIQDVGLLPDCEIVLIFPNSVFSEENITPSLKVLIARSTGIDNIKCQDALNNLGVQIVRNETASTQSVSEYVLACIFHELMGDYFMYGAMRPEVASKKVVIFGGGRIGRRTQEILESVGCEVVVITQKIPGRTNDLDVLKDADIVCLLTSLRTQTMHLCDEVFFAALKPNTILISPARSDLIKMNALVGALNDGIIRHAYLDLCDLHYAKIFESDQRVTLTSYTAWATPPAIKRYEKFVFEALRSAIG